MPKTTWFTEYGRAGDYFGPRPYRSLEDGYLYYDWPEGWVVIAWNSYGREYVHERRFDSQAEAASLCERARLRFEAGGQPDLRHWSFVRVQYGSQAYLDEEPHIVHREREEALWAEQAGDRLPIKLK